MISQNLITSVLLGMVITGVIPIIGGIVLLATGKLKGSSFWAGVLAYLISMIAYAIASGIYTFATMDMTDLTSAAVMDEETSQTLNLVMSMISSVFMAIAMGICIACCMKLRTLKAAVSCGCGFGISYLLTIALSFVTIYFSFVQINSGAFDEMYRTAIEDGMITKEMFNELKAQIVNVPVSEMVLTTVYAVLTSVLFIAIAIFIMYGVCTKNTFNGIAAATLVMVLTALPAVIPNLYVGIAIGAVISIAAIVIAFKMKDKIVPPQKPVVQDAFLQTVENSRQEEEQNQEQ